MADTIDTWVCTATVNDGPTYRARATATNDPTAQNAALMKVAGKANTAFKNGREVTIDCKPV